MMCPLDLQPPLEPALHKNHPLELHWRKHPPSIRGNIEKAYTRMYPHLVDEILCLQCGAVPCPYTHDMEEKQKQRVADMEFIKELALDRKQMKIEIENMADKMDDMKQQERSLIHDREVLRNKVSLFEALESEWKRTKMLLDAEIKRLRQLDERSQDVLSEYKQDRMKLQYTQQKLKDSETENERLQTENQKVKNKLMNQSAEISSLTRENGFLQKEFANAKSKVNSLKVEIESSKAEMTSLQKQVRDKDCVIVDMERQLTEIVEELTEKTNLFEKKEREFEELIDALKSHVQNLKDSQKASESKIKDLLKEIEILEKENDVLKKKLANDKRFQQFVQIKRECNILKDFSGGMAQKLQDYENNRPLPIVKRDGRTSKKSTKACGPGARPKSGMLNRPKFNKDDQNRKAHFKNLNEDILHSDDFSVNTSKTNSVWLKRRPQSARPQFRSPTVVGCKEDAEMYMLDDKKTILTSKKHSRRHIKHLPSHSTLKRNTSANNTSTNNSEQVEYEGNDSFSRVQPPGISIIEENSDVLKHVDNMTNVSGDLNEKGTSEVMVTEVQHHCTPESSDIGSDIDNISFEALDAFEI